MTSQTSPTRVAIAGRRATLPEHVVHRAFAHETILLNLRTGLYHGLNATAGRMLEAMTAGPGLDAVVEQLAREYGQPVDRIRMDVAQLAADLVERDLIELRPET
jgi:Coenzyme PQQ synthesis protein D (PqqD)